MERKDIINRFLERGVLIGPRALDRALGMPPEVLDKAILNLNELPPVDTSDALAVAICHINFLKILSI